MSYSIIGAPGRYIQGRNIINDICEHAGRFGKRYLLISDELVYTLVGEKIKRSFAAGGKEVVWAPFGGESSEAEIEQAGKLLQHEKCEAVIGAGGGKALDTAKAVGYEQNVPLVIIPTIAATDAPCSALAVIYKENELPRNLHLPRNPDLVLVDTELIAKAPVRTLVAGMGDAFATWYEARACKQSSAPTPLFGLGTNSAYALAKLSHDILLEDGVKAKVAAENRTVTRALENIIETNIYLSGVGFENNGCAVAHGFYNGVSSLPIKHHFMHGECVAFGTLVQLVLENAPNEEFLEAQRFFYQIGLPLTLKDLQLDVLIEKELRLAVKGAIKDGITHNMPFAVTEEAFYDAVVNADRLGRIFLKEASHA